MEETTEGSTRTKRVRIALETKIPSEAMEDFTEDDLEKLDSNGFGNAIALSLASEKTLMDVLPGRRGVVTVIVAFFAKPQEASEIDGFKPTLQDLGRFLAEQSRRSLRISEVNSTAWEDFRGSQSIKTACWVGPLESTENETPTVDRFIWEDRLERAQADRYLPYLKNLLQLDTREWTLFDAANKNIDLLRQKLGTYEFKGTTDVAVIHRRSTHLPGAALRIIFELKKGPGIDNRAVFQTMISLLLANVKSEFLKPAAVLTDLDDSWILFWIDKLTIFSHQFESRARAVGKLRQICKEFQLRDEISSTDPSPNAASGPGEGSSGALERSFSKRQKLSIPEMERLDEFAGLISEEELRRDGVDIALGHLFQNQMFCSLYSDDQVSSPQEFDGMPIR